MLMSAIMTRTQHLHDPQCMRCAFLHLLLPILLFRLFFPVLVIRTSQSFLSYSTLKPSPNFLLLTHCALLLLLFLPLPFHQLPLPPLTCPLLGLDHVAALKDELKPLVEALEATKKKLYFPLSATAIGQVRNFTQLLSAVFLFFTTNPTIFCFKNDDDGNGNNDNNDNCSNNNDNNYYDWMAYTYDNDDDNNYNNNNNNN